MSLKSATSMMGLKKSPIPRLLLKVKKMADPGPVALDPSA
jgi:hypothetical protein